MADIHKTNVVKIEPQANENGTEFLLVTISKKDKMGKETLKQKKIYEFGMQEVLEAGPGTYNFSYEKQEDGSYWLVGIAALDGSEPTKPVTKPVLKASTASNTASKNDSGAAKPSFMDNQPKDKQFRSVPELNAEVLIDATVRTMAGTPPDSDVFMMLADQIFNFYARLLKGYISAPEKEAQAAKELEKDSKVPDAWSQI